MARPLPAHRFRRHMLVSEASRYAELHIPIIPLHTVDERGCSCGSSSCSSPGKHPRTRRGHKDATTDAEIIFSWWNEWPDANIGVVTGQDSRLWVLDLDPRNGSGESVRRLGDLPRTPTVLTGGGGTHYYFAAPEGACASRCGILPGIDLKGDGGYVVAPPSLHKSGEVYTWHVSLEDARPAFMPSSLRALIEQRRPPLRANGVVHEGGRNDFLFRSGCSLINRCEDPGALIQELARLNQDQCQPPLPRQEVASIVASVSRYVQPPAGSGAPAGLLRALAGVQLTDDVVGQLVFEIHGCDLRYCGDRERWLVWNGKRWDLDYGNEAERRATRTVQCLRELLAGAESTVADPDAAQAGPDAGPMDGGLS